MLHLLPHPVHVPLALPGFAELWPILVVVLLFFGGRKLPELARAMGSSITQFRKGLDEATDPETKAVEGDKKDD